MKKELLQTITSDTALEYLCKDQSIPLEKKYLVRKVLSFLKEVTQLEYEQTPNYEELCKIIMDKSVEESVEDSQNQNTTISEK